MVKQKFAESNYDTRFGYMAEVGYSPIFVHPRDSCWQYPSCATDALGSNALESLRLLLYDELSWRNVFRAGAYAHTPRDVKSV